MNIRNGLRAALCAACLAIMPTTAAPAVAATPAWQPIVVSGPTNLPPVQSETQKLALEAEGGTFTLSAHHVVATGMGRFNGSEQITDVVTTSGSFAIGQAIDGPGIPAGSTIGGVAGGSLALKIPEEEKLGADFGGNHFIAVDGVSATTAPLAFDAGAAEVEAALNSLGLINAGGGSVSVTGGPGGPGATHPYHIAFGGSLANTDVPAITVNTSGLLGVTQGARVTSTVPGGPSSTTLAVYLQNVGGLTSSGTVTVSVELPPGVTTVGTPVDNEAPHAWSCSPGGGQSTFSCTSSNAIPGGAVSASIAAPVSTGMTTQATNPVKVTVSGGSAGPASFSAPLTISPDRAGPGIQVFTAGAYNTDGELDTRAGAHPYTGSSAVFVNTYRNNLGRVVPAGEFRDIVVELPPGFLGNPIATPQCPERNLATATPVHPSCEAETIVGRAAPVITQFGVPAYDAPVYNIEAPLGYPAKFFFEVLSLPVQAVGSVRSDGDYGLTVASIHTPQIATVYGTFFTFWGAPADPTHDPARCDASGRPLCAVPLPSSAPNTAFLTNPVDCAREAIEPPIARLKVNTWQEPLTVHTEDVAVPAVTECDKLKFEADFTFEPSDTKSDSPASFRTELTVPSEGLTDPKKLMTPTINESVVDLPKGVVLNASAADGLGACSKAQIGLMGTNFPPPNRIRFSKAPQTCPDNSKIGTGELKSELLEDPLKGDLYLAAQGDGNPFGSLFAIYLVIEDPRHGIFIKLPGEVQVNDKDGQQRVVFRDLPPLPFTYLRLNLKGGNRSPLASPPICGKYVTTTTNTPWSAPESGAPTTSANGFEINQGPNGGACSPTMASRPFNLGLRAGTDSIGAGAFSPLTFQITRPDGAQEIDTLELTTAKGLAASLKGIPNCSDAAISAASSKTGQQELSSPACPSASQIGRTLVGSGSGPTPFYSGGKLYLAGPYKGAPLSVVAITPAVAGPFDLGNVVVRTAVFLNRSTAQVTAKADPIPQILKGVPLRIRDVRVILDRPGFSLNPTSCDASQIDVKVTGNSGATTNLSNRFQVAGCQDLAFKPKFSGKVIGGTKRGDHPKFTAEVEWPQGAYANTKDVAVTLPRSEFLDQANIRTICTRVQAAANQCPAGAIYGEAEAITPLLDEPLKGPVFLKSSDNKLPDLAIKLRGPDSKPIEVEFQGRIDSIGGRIRNTIEGLPDVPVSKFVLRMQGGRKGLLVNSRNLCTTKRVRMEVHALGQNNKRSDQNPVLGNSCKKSQLKKAARKAKRKAQRAHRRQAG